MDEKTPTEFVPKKQLTKGQMIAVIAVGVLMLLLSIVIPTEKPSTAHTIKVIVGILGVCIVIAGLAFRPIKAPKNPKK
jgi:protein-S-isoprenylcysteine O-methyltransferase Ste14